MAKKFRFMKCFFSASIFLSTCIASAQEFIHDNLGPFDSKVRSFLDFRPGLFGLKQRKVFVRRDQIVKKNNLDVAVSFLSGTGNTLFRSNESDENQALEELNNARFENVSGSSANGDFGAPPFKLNKDTNILNGVNLKASALLAEISSTIYLNFPEASKKFTNMGFNEQHFLVGIKSDSQGVVLKNKDFIVLAFRGTQANELTDWMTDAKFAQVPLLPGAKKNNLKVHLGFHQAASELWPLIRGEFSSTLENKIRNIVSEMSVKKPEDTDDDVATRLMIYGINGKVAPPDNRAIYLTGHSLGGAIATLIYGELTFNWMDFTNLGYFFSDPTLSLIPNEKINALIQNTLEENPLAFSFNETTAFNTQSETARMMGDPLKREILKKGGYLAHLGVIQNEKEFSATPVNNHDDVTIDNRIKSLTTFGCPRVGDWPFKYAIEKYASVTGSEIIRYENFYKEAKTDNGILKADVVTRVPLERIGSGYFFPEYTHSGNSVSFESEELDVKGDPNVMECTYTNIDHEKKIGQAARTSFSISYHNMSLYLKRVKSYVGKRLAENHSCSRLNYEPPEL